MSEKYDNELRGVLFKNNRRVKDTQPEYTGNVQVGGQEYWLSAWVKTSQDGSKFFSLALTAKDEKPVTANVSADVDVNSDIPF